MKTQCGNEHWGLEREGTRGGVRKEKKTHDDKEEEERRRAERKEKREKGQTDRSGALRDSAVLSALLRAPAPV